MDGRAGTADALEDTSDQAGLEGGAQVGHTAGNSDIVRRVIEDEDEDYPRGTSVSIEKADTGEMATVGAGSRSMHTVANNNNIVFKMQPVQGLPLITTTADGFDRICDLLELDTKNLTNPERCSPSNTLSWTVQDVFYASVSFQGCTTTSIAQTTSCVHSRSTCFLAVLFHSELANELHRPK